MSLVHRAEKRLLSSGEACTLKAAPKKEDQMDIQTRATTNLINAITASTLVIVGLLVWNLWLHEDPLFFMTMLTGEQVAPVLPAVPWLISGVIVVFCLAMTTVLYAGYRMACGGPDMPESTAERQI